MVSSFGDALCPTCGEKMEVQKSVNFDNDCYTVYFCKKDSVYVKITVEAYKIDPKLEK